MLTIIGDVHGKFDEYLRLTEKYEYTVQLGDMGFNYERIWNLKKENHVWFPGNHDHHYLLNDVRPESYLGRYGVHKMDGMEFFYIGGAFSIDWRMRTPGVDFFNSEELSQWEWDDCLRLYEESKPHWVITHDCPVFMYPHLGIEEEIRQTTPNMLAKLYDIHQPQLWFYGHHHKTHKLKMDESNINSTYFRCLSELETYWI